MVNPRRIRQVSIAVFVLALHAGAYRLLMGSRLAMGAWPKASNLQWLYIQTPEATPDLSLIHI